jgi:hypothetical protein
MKIKEMLIKGKNTFIIWTIIGIAVNVLAMLYFKPWGDSLGVAYSPKRLVLYDIFDWWVMKLPTVLLAASIIASKEFWLAPRGRYQEGKKYPLLNTYGYVAIAFCAALFTAAGIFNFNLFDLAAAPATLSVTFFHPIIGFFTLWLGGVARSLVFGTGNPISNLLGEAISDGGTWIWLGIFYWWFREETKAGKNPVWVIIYWIVLYIGWRTVYQADEYFWFFPAPAVWARWVWHFTNFLPSGLSVGIPTLIAVEALIRSAHRGQKGPAPETK